MLSRTSKSATLYRDDSHNRDGGGFGRGRRWGREADSLKMGALVRKRDGSSGFSRREREDNERKERRQWLEEHGGRGTAPGPRTNYRIVVENLSRRTSPYVSLLYSVLDEGGEL